MHRIRAVTGALGRSRSLVGSGYRLDVYRTSAFTPELAVRTPIFSDLVPDESHKPPIAVEQAGRPRRGRKRKNPVLAANERAAPPRDDAVGRGDSRANEGEEGGAAPQPRPGSPPREGEPRSPPREGTASSG